MIFILKEKFILFLNQPIILFGSIIDLYNTIWFNQLETGIKKVRYKWKIGHVKTVTGKLMLQY